VWLFSSGWGDTIFFMNNTKRNQDHIHEEGDALSRSRLFVLLDGTFAVRWTENSVQELGSGHYRAYEKRDFGANITDYELNQLKLAGLVERYDKNHVWLCHLPEHLSSNGVDSWENSRTRSYYLHTTLSGSLLGEVEQVLDELNLFDNFHARVRDDFVMLWGERGVSFRKFDEAEKARFLLASKAPEVFGDAVVAFIETTKKK
jgi:hypothetical protein